MSTTATPPCSVGYQLKTATATLHRRVERTPFMASLLRGEVDRQRYVGLLLNLQALYAALEEALTRHGTTPCVAPVVMPELFRGRAIAADLQALAGDGLPAHAPLTAAMQQYVERLHILSTAKPGLLVAHAYVRYLGDLNGGQALRRVVARSLGLEGGSDNTGTHFYDFGDSITQQRLVQRFRAGLEAAAAQLQDPQALTAEAISAFERHECMFEELACA